jgi:hypothetical protein
MHRNITLALEEEVLSKARVLAARRGMSVSALLRSELTRLADEEDSYSTAKDAALARLRSGTRLGATPLPARDEVHDRAGLR